MKRYIIALLALTFSLMVSAEGFVRLTVYVGSTKDRSRIPVEIHLTNNEVNISGIAGYLFHPAGSRFVDPENPGGEVACTPNSTRCQQSHQLDFASDKKDKNGLDRLFFTFLSRKNEPLKMSSGQVIKLYLDCSDLEDGEYQIFPLKMEGIGTDMTSYIFEEESVPVEFKLGGETEEIEVNSTGTASHVSEHELDFTGSPIKAYVATHVDGENIYLQQVNDIPAYSAFVVKGEPDRTYDIDVIDAAPSAYTNLFEWGEMMVYDWEWGDAVYALSNKDGLFHRVEAGVTIPDGKAYIRLEPNAAKVLRPIFDDATGIRHTFKNGGPVEIYNLSGQRVSEKTKGMVIVNGVKVKK